MEIFVQEIVKEMLQYGLVTEEEKENYCYYIEILLEKVIGIGSIILISFILDKVIQMLFLMCSFSSIRRYSGGFHCKSFLGCYFLSLMVCGMGVCPFFIDSIFRNQTVTLMTTLLSMIVLFMIGAVNHPNMSWDIQEMQHSKDMARSMTALMGSLVFSIEYLGIFSQYVNYLAEGIWISAGSGLVAKIIRQEVKI